MESDDIEITVLYNDIPGDTRLETAHGLACLIEGKGSTILFDTGGDGHLLLDNMRKLGKDPKRIDIVQRAGEIRPGEIAVTLGGFHLKDSDESKVNAVIKALKDLGVKKMGCSHCTGGPQTEMFQKTWQNDFIPFGCGATLRLELPQ